jgi:molybdenum cofactor cytidylyltransferase
LKFGRLAVAESEGAILAHAVKRPGLALKKGEVVNADHIAALTAAGVEAIIAAKLEADDVPENSAAQRLAARLAGPNISLDRPFTGRCNLLAEVVGLVLIEMDTINRINAVDEAITVATLMPFRPVSAGEIIATVKIIPFSVPASSLDAALAETSKGAIQVVPFRPLRVGVVSTLLPGLKASVVDKTLRVLDKRLAPAASTIEADVRIRHDTTALVSAIRDAAKNVDLLVIFGASAITDRRDVVPTALEGAGGTVLHLGMPVDPGNLLLLGELPMPDGRSIPVIGAPGCARSPKENGFDFVLQRILAGVPVRGTDLRRMGVGGLLSEIVSRPQPRNPLDV